MIDRKYIKNFVKNYKEQTGQEIGFVDTSTGRRIYLNDMTDEDAQLVAMSFSLMVEVAKEKSEDS
jgi:hypothetical protein